MAVKLACLLCGAEDTETRVGLIAWKHPIGNARYAAVPRCRDREACRRTVELTGEAWEVDEPGAGR